MSNLWLEMLESRWPGHQEQLKPIRSLINEVAIKAPSLDFKDVEANGLRTALVIVTAIGSTLMSTNDGDKVKNTLTAIDVYLQRCLERSKPRAIDAILEYFKALDAHKDVLVKVRRDFKAAHLADGIGKKLSWIEYTITPFFGARTFLEVLKLVISSRSRFNVLAATMVNSSIRAFTKYCKFGNLPLLTFLNARLVERKFKDIERRTCLLEGYVTLSRLS